jgi:uncharacterized membrane protein
MVAASTTLRQPGALQVAGGHTRQRHVNVGDTERWLSGVGGTVLALFGLSRGDLVGLGLAIGGGLLAYRGVTGHCPCYQALGLSTAPPHGPATSVAAGRGVKVEKSVTINAPREQLYRFWRNLENLPRIMSHLVSVTEQGDTSHWVAKGPLNMPVEWDAQIVNEKPNELIAWQSLRGSVVDNAGSVHFSDAPGRRGTEVRVVLKYDPPAGKVGGFIAKLFRRAPEQEIEDELRRFKQLVETGEIAAIEG